MLQIFTYSIGLGLAAPSTRIRQSSGATKADCARRMAPAADHRRPATLVPPDSTVCGWESAPRSTRRAARCESGQPFFPRLPRDHSESLRTDSRVLLTEVPFASKRRRIL